MSADYLPWLLRVLLPEACLVLGALLVLTADMIWGRGQPARRRDVALLLGLVTLAVAGSAAVTSEAAGQVHGRMLQTGQLATATRVTVILLAGFALALLPDSRRLRHPAEFTAILLFATTGFTLMAAANNLLLAFLALELASLSLYVLAGFDKTSPESAEAGLKYFLFGGMAAAFLLFGFSLLYGLTGSLQLNEIGPQIARLTREAPPPLLLVALVMILVAFGFKAAAAPFHLWAPDVYQGAPTPAAALIASASKLAGVVFFTRLLWYMGNAAGKSFTLHYPATLGWAAVVALIAAASLLLGNVGALAQSNVRRLLAYSAIAHAGTLLLALLIRPLGEGPLFYYAATYGLATVGAFGVIAGLESAGPVQRLTDLAGLHKRSPLLAGCLAVFILSLAGIPPLAGFFGKFAIFAVALREGVAGPVGWLALLAIAVSAVALYYYLVILKQALVAAPTAEATPVKVPLPAALALLLAAGLIVALGLWPSVVLGLF